MIFLKGLAVIWGFALFWLFIGWCVKGWVHLAFLVPALLLDKGNKNK
tara:strand:- start:310 stop:450 length:141 start_codon:yes stop_codon:yes gene_type:complete